MTRRRPGCVALHLPRGEPDASLPDRIGSRVRTLASRAACRARSCRNNPRAGVLRANWYEPRLVHPVIGPTTRPHVLQVAAFPLGCRPLHLDHDLGCERLLLLVQGVQYRGVDVFAAARDLAGHHGQQWLAFLDAVTLLNIGRIQKAI